MKRATKKERQQQRKAEEAAAREQIEKWISAKSRVSLIYPGPFFAAGVEGNLMRNPSEPDGIEFLGLQTPFRLSIALNRCKSYKCEGPRKNVALWMEAASGFALILADSDNSMPDVAELLKLSGGRPN